MDTIKIRGFHHINIKAQDFDSAEQFYMKLGFRKVHSWSLKEFSISKCVMMFHSEAEMYIEICDRDARMPTQGRPRKEGEGYVESALLHICFFVDNADQAYQEAIKAGATPLNALNKIALIDDLGNKLEVVNSLVYSPNGEVIEFIETDPFRQFGDSQRQKESGC